MLLNLTTERAMNMLNLLFGKKKITVEQMENKMFSMFEKKIGFYDIKVIDSKEQLVIFSSLYIKRDLLGSDVSLVADFKNKTLYDDEGPYLYEEASVSTLSDIKKEMEHIATLLEFKRQKSSLDEILEAKRKKGIVYK